MTGSDRWHRVEVWDGLLGGWVELDEADSEEQALELVRKHNSEPNPDRPDEPKRYRLVSFLELEGESV